MKGDEGIWFTGYQNVFKFTACLVMQKASTGETQKDCGSKCYFSSQKLTDFSQLTSKPK